MKRISILFAALLLVGTTAIAETTKASEVSSSTNFVRGYGNSFIFVERGIEFSVFPDGQFDFYMSNYGPNVNAGFGNGNVSISFNTGYNYDPYVQYDDFGAIVQIENVPIYYDYYGRISRAGNVRIFYNSFGRIARVGSLYVHYNRYNAFSHCTGFINPFNRYYVERPWHRFYRVPALDFCVVFNRPYRQYYRPYRHAYYRPYKNNHRPRFDRSYSSSRRGKVAHTKSRRSDRYKQSNNGRRGDVADSPRRTRTTNDVVRRTDSRRGKQVTDAPRRGNTKERANTPKRRGNNSSSTIKGNRVTKPRVAQNERPHRRVTSPRSNTPRVNKPRTQDRRKAVSTQNRRSPSMKQRTARSKPKSRVAQRSATSRAKASSSRSRGNSKSTTSRSRRGLQK